MQGRLDHHDQKPGQQHPDKKRAIAGWFGERAQTPPAINAQPGEDNKGGRRSREQLESFGEIDVVGQTVDGLRRRRAENFTIEPAQRFVWSDVLEFVDAVELL